MHDESLVPRVRALLASLFIILGSVFLVYGYGYSRIDWSIVFTFFYTTVAFLLVEKKISVPPLTRAYENEMYERLSILLFLPSAFLLYKIGYKYNLALMFQDTFAYFISSALLGVGLGLALIIVSIAYELSGVRENERPNNP